MGSIAGIAAGKENETKCKLRIQIIGSSLPRMDTFGEADPFVEIHRQSDEYYHRDMELKTGEHKEAWTLVHTTETIEHSLSPKFKPFILSVWDACKGDYLRPLKFRCMDWNKTGASDFIGEFQTTLFDIFKQNEPFKLIDARNQNKQDYQHSGKLEVRVKLNSKEELAAWDEDFKEVLKPIITAYKSSNSSSSGRSGLSSRKKKDNKKKANSALDLKIKMQEQHAQKFAKR